MMYHGSYFPSVSISTVFDSLSILYPLCMIWFTHICVVFRLFLGDNCTSEILTWEPKAKRSDRHSSPVLLFRFLLKTLTSPVVSAALASVAGVSHSALHRPLDTPTLGIRATCHLPYTTVLSTPWRTFVTSLVCPKHTPVFGIEKVFHGP